MILYRIQLVSLVILWILTVLRRIDIVVLLMMNDTPCCCDDDKHVRRTWRATNIRVTLPHVP